jgi:hypothetical protein
MFEQCIHGTKAEVTSWSATAPWSLVVVPIKPLFKREELQDVANGAEKSRELGVPQLVRCASVLQCLSITDGGIGQRCESEALPSEGIEHTKHTPCIWYAFVPTIVALEVCVRFADTLKRRESRIKFGPLQYVVQLQVLES